ncbi:MAG: hypothetical protein MJA30_32485, partial [Cytophagales bacterium]|nr:hypothetical protein [Cytophagales bacterium]
QPNDWYRLPVHVLATPPPRQAPLSTDLPTATGMHHPIAATHQTSQAPTATPFDNYGKGSYARSRDVWQRFWAALPSPNGQGTWW